MRIALAACEASQTDLYEYFKVWGFFNYAEDTSNTNDDGVASITDYETFYLKIPRKSVSSEVAQMEAWKAEMQSYTNKAPGIMFINSTATQGKIPADAEVVKYFPDLLGTNVTNYEAGNDSGCLGHHLHPEVRHTRLHHHILAAREIRCAKSVFQLAEGHDTIDRNTL